MNSIEKNELEIKYKTLFEMYTENLNTIAALENFIDKSIRFEYKRENILPHNYHLHSSSSEEDSGMVVPSASSSNYSASDFSRPISRSTSTDNIQLGTNSVGSQTIPYNLDKEISALLPLKDSDDHEIASASFFDYKFFLIIINFSFNLCLILICLFLFLKKSIFVI